LEVHPKPLIALVWAELKLMEQRGVLPQFSVCVLTGKPVQEANPPVSPHAGGYVVLGRIETYTDRVQTLAEVLYGLVALTELEEPPANFKHAEESLWVLYPFWKAIADRPLPANESVVREIRHAL